MFTGGKLRLKGDSGIVKKKKKKEKTSKEASETAAATAAGLKKKKETEERKEADAGETAAGGGESSKQRDRRTDAERNCLSNIHPGGLSPADAATRLWWLAGEARRLCTTGVALKDRSGEPGRLGERRASTPCTIAGGVGGATNER